MERYEDHERPVDFDDSSEAIFVRTVEGMQVTHRETLENVVLFAKHQHGANEVGRELLRTSGRRLTEEFRMCVDLIDMLEPEGEERRALMSWLLMDEQSRRLTFINFYSGMTGIEIVPKTQRNIMQTIDRLRESGEADAETVYFYNAFNTDAVRFVRAYQTRQA